MRRILLMGILLLAGCQSVVGPRERRDNPERIDDPRLTAREQERRERELLATPLASPTVGPRTYMEVPNR